MAKQRIPVQMDDLQEALDYFGYEIDYYLDLDTGQVIMLHDDIRLDLQKIWNDDPAKVEAAIQALDLGDEEKDMLRAAAAIEQEEGARFIPIPHAESQDNYETMEDFIDTISDLKLRQKLATSIQGKGAFRRFRDVLVSHPDEEARWYAYKDEQARQRALQWLDEEGIEAI
jgi:hypothetical protein